MKSTQHHWQHSVKTDTELFNYLSEGYNESDKALLEQALEDLWTLPDEHPKHLPRPEVVAATLKSLNVDCEILVATILGSYYFAQYVDIAQIRKDYGVKIAKLAESVRWLNSLNIKTQQQKSEKSFSTQQTEVLRRMVLSMVEDVRAVLIRLAFRVQRMHLLKYLEPAEQKRIAEETLKLYAPIANRLGVAQLKWEMEDMAFRVLEPESYMRIATALEERREDRETYVKNFVAQLSEFIKSEGIHSAHVYGRPKNIYSIWMKMKRKRLEFKDLFDVRAVRVLVDTVQECYGVLGVVHSNWTLIAREFDDYVANPKDNGYQSLHTAVLGDQGKAVEVQIRTYQMNEDAELGVAAHWRYKEGRQQDDRLQRNINSLRQLLDNQDDDAFLESVATEVFNDRVFVFTPGGDVVDLPAGSTALDFAYQVHTEIGHKCRGAKINGRIVPLTQPLENSDQVEVLTSKDSVPRRDWLNKELGYLVTSRARAKVRAWFNQQDQDQHRADGKFIIERELKRLGFSTKTKSQEQLMKKLRLDSIDKMYVWVGRNEISSEQLVRAIISLDESEQPLPPLRPIRNKPSSSNQDRTNISVGGVGSLLTQIASCCKPVPYDSIVGFITQGKGVSVHRQDCKNVLNLSVADQARLIDVDWGESESETYSVNVWLLAIDRQGLVRDVSALLSNEKISLTAINTLSNKKDQTAEMTMTLEINNIEHLSRVMEKLRQLKNVLEVERR